MTSRYSTTSYYFLSTSYSPCLRCAEPVTGHPARLGSRLPAQLYRGRHFRRHGFVRFQGATRTDPSEPNSGTRLLPRVSDDKAHTRPGMKDPRSGEKLVDQLRHSRPHQMRLLT